MVDSTAPGSLSFTLGSGEAVTVVVDDDTAAVAFEEQEVTRRGWSRTRLAPTEIEVADIEDGAGIVVWSDATDGEDFVASRIMVQPADEAEAAEAEADEVEADEATEETEAEEA